MEAIEDKGASFQMNLSPQLRYMSRKRSNTFPSTPNCSNFLTPDYDSEEENIDDIKLFSPKKPDSRISIPRSLYRSNDYRSSSTLTPNNTPNTSIKNLLTKDTKPFENHWDPNYTPLATNHSIIPSITSPMNSLTMTPISLFNSPNMPQIRYWGYSPLYSPFYGNHYDYQTAQMVSHSDRIADLAKQHRNAATHAEARHTWSGTLPITSTHKPPVYSSKVFLGGVPWEMTDHDIKLTFSRFGNVQILRPGQHVRLSRSSQNKDKAGYLYLIFDSDKQVKSLINACTHDFTNGGKYYFALNQSRYRPKDVQIIPWNTNDTSFVKVPSARVDANKTVFVGALHGMLTAEGLACILEDLFGGVVYVGIDTDKYKYPIGSGRVTFSTTKAYNKAVQAAFIDVKCNRFQKKIQIDPFLEEVNCSQCRSEKGPIFCRDICMTYYCRNCWDILHSSEGMRCHQPIMKNKTKF